MTPMDIATQEINLEDDIEDIVNELACRAVFHYERGHWAEARTAALISQAFAALAML